MINKRAYIKPVLESETFVPQNYIAACNDVTVTWKINCNVPQGYGFIDSNGNGKKDYDESKIVSGSGCGVYHTVDLPRGQEPQKNAMWQPQRWVGGIFGHYADVGNAIPVFYWEESVTGLGKSDHHFSKVEEGDWHVENHS